MAPRPCILRRCARAPSRAPQVSKGIRNQAGRWARRPPTPRADPRGCSAGDNPAVMKPVRLREFILPAALRCPPFGIDPRRTAPCWHARKDVIEHNPLPFLVGPDACACELAHRGALVDHCAAVAKRRGRPLGVSGKWRTRSRRPKYGHACRRIAPTAYRTPRSSVAGRHYD